MSTLLKIDSSPRGEYSASRQLTATFTARWLESHPGSKVIERDLNAGPALPFVDLNWIGAAFTPPDARTPEQKEALAVSETLIGELEAADEYVIGVPMINFGVPAAFKAYIDQIVRAGRTFRYGASGPEGLLKEKKATFLIASGGVYQPNTPAAAMDFVIPYLKAIFGFLGVTDATFIAADGTAAIMQGKVTLVEHLAPTLERVLAHAAAQ